MKFKFRRFIFVGSWLLLCLATALNAIAESYRNPVVPGMNPDPSIVRTENDYYLVTSTFEYFPGCALYHSEDLVHWQMIGYALNRPQQFAVLHSKHPALYACTLRYHDGTYYVLTTDVRSGWNFLVTAKTPSGPWSDPILIDRGMFDPSLFFDDDGKVYYQRRGPHDGENIVQAQIDVATGKLLTPLRTISTGMMTEDSEGPHLYKIDGWYYLSEAEGSTRALHQQTVGRAHSPWGPFTPDPVNPWASQHISSGYPVHGLGHCDLVDTPKGEWWTVCLATREVFSIGRETFLFHVQWKDGWPTLDPHDLQTLTLEGAPPTKFPDAGDNETAKRDNFDGLELQRFWNTIGPLGVANYSLNERRGYLRLHGQPDELSFDHPTAFVGRRQTEPKTVSTAALEFDPHLEGESAGLTVLMSPAYHYDFVKTLKGGKTVVELVKQVSDIRTIAAEVPVGKGTLLIRIASDGRSYKFSYANSVGSWIDLGIGDARLISSEVADVWSGAYIGIFSTSPDAAHGSPADFDWFEYHAER